MFGHEVGRALSARPTPSRDSAYNGAQTLGSPTQLNPDSTVQKFEQPSPLVAPPSSQPSAPRTKPSPQTVPQTLGVPTQVQPVSWLQLDEQPSPLEAFPSSQVSDPLTTPSPQTGTHIPDWQIEPPPWLHEVLSGTTGWKGDPIKHWSDVHWLPSFGTSMLSSTTVVEPAPSQTVRLQSPAVCDITMVPALAKLVPQAPMEQVGSCHSVAIPGQSIADAQVNSVVVVVAGMVLTGAHSRPVFSTVMLWVPNWSSAVHVGA